jgi:hypothetical protein
MLNKLAFGKLLIVVSIASGSLIAAPDARAKEIAGVVTSVSGTWFVDGVKVARGQKLAAGVVIKAKEPNAKYGRVVVMLLDFTEVSRICDRRGFCGEPVRLPDTVEEPTRSRSRAGTSRPGLWGRVVTAINRSRGQRYIRSLARGGVDLPDGVVRLENGRIDLSSVFKGVTAREILLNVEAVRNEDGSVSGMIAERLRLRWSGRGRAVVKVPNVTPGLYRITFAEPDGGGGSVLPGDVWVLVAEPARYRRAATEYRKARALTANWDSETEPQAQSFLRGFLLTLASENLR